MKLITQLKISSFCSVVLFCLLYGVFDGLPIVDGQYETANNHCGGIFRSVKGSIDFTFNSHTNPNGTAKKICMWTIIPNPFQSHIKFTLNSTSNLICPSNDNLGFTSFKESSTAIDTHTTCTSGATFILRGSVIVVSLISKSPRDGAGFKLSWDRPDDRSFYSRIRFVTAFYSYGRASSRPIPYFAAHFMGNSLSTFAFSSGNRTQGYILETKFRKIDLSGRDRDCPRPRPGDGEYPLCNALLVCQLEDDGLLSISQVYNSTKTTDVAPIRSPNGLFLIMWGGNQYNATGGGTMVLTYTHARFRG